MTSTESFRIFIVTALATGALVLLFWGCYKKANANQLAKNTTEFVK